MDKWIDCSDFIAHDVIRFEDGIWERKGPKSREKSFRVGSRQISAQVMETYIDGGDLWVVLEVISCEIVEDRTGGRQDRLIKAGEQIKRLRKSLVKYGKPRRLPWQDEHGREVVAAEQLAPAARKRKEK